MNSVHNCKLVSLCSYSSPICTLYIEEFRSCRAAPRKVNLLDSQPERTEPRTDDLVSQPFSALARFLDGCRKWFSVLRCKTDTPFRMGIYFIYPHKNEVEMNRDHLIISVTILP